MVKDHAAWKVGLTSTWNEIDPPVLAKLKSLGKTEAEVLTKAMVGLTEQARKKGWPASDFRTPLAVPK